MGDQAKISLRGVIKKMLPIQQISDKFKKREIWLAETGEHAQTFSLEFHNDTCRALENFREGEQVECFINIRGRHWQKNGKEGVMNTLQCWKITTHGAPHPTPAQPPTTQSDNSDDLPF